MPKTPDLANWQPKESDARYVEDTAMLNTTARETSDTVTSESTHNEYVAKNPAFGKLGSK